MSKKFEGLDSIFSSTVAPEKIEAPAPKKVIGEVRATFIVENEVLEKIKALAYWNRKNIKQVVNDALKTHISKQGEIREIP
jgi:hypothetical protein